MSLPLPEAVKVTLVKVAGPVPELLAVTSRTVVRDPGSMVELAGLEAPTVILTASWVGEEVGANVFVTVEVGVKAEMGAVGTTEMVLVHPAKIAKAMMMDKLRPDHD